MLKFTLSKFILLLFTLSKVFTYLYQSLPNVLRQNTHGKPVLP